MTEGMVVLLVAVMSAGAASTLMYLIHTLARIRLAEDQLFRGASAGLSEADLDALAAKLAQRLDRTDLDRKQLLEIAKMTESEFAFYKEQLAIERQGLAAREPETRRTDERPRERA